MMHSNGEYGRPPLYGVGHRASCSAGLVAYIGILAALLARRQHGGGQTVRTDIAETAASMCFPYVMQYLYNGTVRTRNDQKQPVCPVECRDGWICMWIYPHLFARACTVLGVPELIGDPRFSATPARQENWSEFVAIMANRLAGRGSEELVAMLQDNGIIAAKAYRPTELVGSEHLRERGYWETIRTPHGERLVLGPQFRFSATPRRLQELWHPALATEGSA
jgi:crotonobetainyl-CoA:carnitine CoA-transferase CaiB-like acyl-CoA transferase